jgi:membrane protease YdiL (CAAX protease family)
VAKQRPPLPDFLQVPWSLGDVVTFVGAWWGLQFLVVAVLVGLAAGVPAAKEFLQAVQSNNVEAGFVLDLVSALVGFGLVGFYLRRYKVGWSAVGWRKANLGKSLLYLAVILVAFLVLASLALWLASLLIPGFNANQAQNNDYTQGAGSHSLISILGLVLVPPALEETLFRGFLFPAIAKRTGLVWGAVLSSALFGLAHWQANVSIYTFVLGLVLCFMYVRLKSIVPGIALHMLNNYLAFFDLTHMHK